jgi:hypothetical protein
MCALAGHEYPEGLPLAIYEALTVRTPLIFQTTHMFCRELSAWDRWFVMFPKKTHLMARCIETLMADPGFMRLFNNSLSAWEKDVKFKPSGAEVLFHWLEDSWKAAVALSA